MEKNLPANARDAKEVGFDRWACRFLRNPLQYSGLESSMDRGAWWATIHRVTKSWTHLNTHTHTHTHLNFLAMPCNVWDLNYLTRDQTCAP